jgi:transcriptional regulator with XRE-family HTH domain
MAIGERFALVLKSKGVTQKSFSEKIGYSEQAISKLIKGQIQSPKADLIAQIAILFPDINLRWLLIGEGQIFNNENTDITTLQIEINNLRKDFNINQEKIIELLENK